MPLVRRREPSKQSIRSKNYSSRTFSSSFSGLS
jgi:hypothetical protein